MVANDGMGEGRSMILMDGDGSVQIAGQGESAGLLTWAGDEASHPTMRFVADDREGRAPAENRVLAGEYDIATWGGISHHFAQPQDWSGFGGIRFWWRASQPRDTSSGAGESIAVEIKDGGPNAGESELWVSSFVDEPADDGSRWKLVELPFDSFEFRTDHQDGAGDTLDGELLLDTAWGYSLSFPTQTHEPIEYRIDGVELYGEPVPILEAAIVPVSEFVLVDGGDDAVLTISAVTRRREPLPESVEVTWSTHVGTAEEGTDFHPATGTVTFAAGEESGTTRSFAIPTLARTGQLTARTFTVEFASTDARINGSIRVALNAQGMPYQDASLSINERIDDLLGRMTAAEKIGQMTQAERRGLAASSEISDNLLGSLLSGGGSVPANNTPVGWTDMVDEYQRAALATRLQIPLIYGIDAVHGHSNMVGATIFPHNIGLGATRNPHHIETQGRITATEIRATGIPWTFAPTLAVSRDARWGRAFESFGEDPALVSLFSAAAIRGLQGDDPTQFDPSSEVLATAKHWLGDGSTAYGTGGSGFIIDQGISYYTSDDEMWQRDVTPYLPAIEAGVGSIMPSYSAVSVAGGEPIRMHVHTELNTGLLKGRMEFDGFLVTDWEAISKLPGDDFADKCVAVINSGVDMAMVPYDYLDFIQALTAAVEAGDVRMSRVDDAVRRILQKKFALGLFEQPYADRTVTEKIGTDEHRAAARAAAADSQVLLTNDGILPLSDDANIYVAGSCADNLGYQMGGWTISWQGGSGDITTGTSIGQAIAAATSGNVTISPDGSAPHEAADLAILIVGEPPYAEGVGDVGDSGFTMELRPHDRALIDRLSAQMPCVVLVVSGRPQITAELRDVNALVASWLPGSEGDGVADVLFGRRPFVGRLPATWPASADQVPITVSDTEQEPEFPFGWGLRTGVTDWTGIDQQRAHRLLAELYREADALEGSQHIMGADRVVVAARDIAQHVIGQEEGDFAVAGDHKRLTAHAEQAFLRGYPARAIALLAEAIGITL